MNKKLVISIIIAVVVMAIGMVAIIIKNSNEDVNTQNMNMEAENNKQITGNLENANEEKKENSKTLVVYYSAQNHTKNVAEKVANNLKADIYEIKPLKEYTSDDLDWTNSNSRVSKEHNDKTLQKVELESSEVPYWEEYDTVLIGFPIWWGVSAWTVDSFVEENNFNGKTVIPFCTSSSSGLGQSGKLLSQKANGGNWLEGHRFSSNASDQEIKKWTDTLEY